VYANSSKPVTNSILLNDNDNDRFVTVLNSDLHSPTKLDI